MHHAQKIIRNLLIVALFWDGYRLAKQQLFKYHQGKYKNHRMKFINRIKRLKVKIPKINLSELFKSKYKGTATVNLSGMNVVVYVTGQKENKDGKFFRVTPMAGYRDTWIHAEEVIPI